MERTTTLGAMALGLACVGLLAGALLADAKSDYEMLFGTEEKRVAATKTTVDDAAFAGKLLDAAKALGDSPELQVLICLKAYEFGRRHRGSHAKALEAIELLEKTFPDRRSEWLPKRLDILELRYRQSYGEARKAAARSYLDVLMGLAERKAAQGDTKAALELYRKAFPVAAYLKSPRAGEIIAKRRSLTEEAAAIERRRGRLKDLKSRLAKDPKDIKAREGLILYYVVELDDLEEAGKLITDDVDERVRTYVPLATKPIPDVPEAACLELGAWYKQLAAGAAGDVRMRLLLRAKAYLDQFLSVHTKQDVPAYKAKLARKAVQAELAKLGLKAAVPVVPGPVTPTARRGFTPEVAAFLKRVVKARAYDRSHVVGDKDAQGERIDNVAIGGLLVGLKVTVGRVAGGREGIRAVQAILSDGQKDTRSPGEQFGDPTGQTHTVVARKGYAVGGLMSVGTPRLDALQVIFMRVTDRGLDVNDLYKSRWYGRTQKGATGLGLDCEGRYVIGITARTPAELKNLGLMLARPRTPKELSGQTPRRAAKPMKVLEVDKYQWVDLLAYVELPKDAYRGEWTRRKGELVVSADSQHGMLVLGGATRESFETSLRCTRLSGQGRILLRFPVGEEHRGWLMLGARREGACGLVFDGKPEKHNQTTVKGKLVVNGKENRVLLRMVYTARDEVEITVTLNGKKIVSWQGKISAFERTSEMASFGLVTQASSVVLHAIQLRLVPPKPTARGK